MRIENLNRVQRPKKAAKPNVRLSGVNSKATLMPHYDKKNKGWQIGKPI